MKLSRHFLLHRLFVLCFFLLAVSGVQANQIQGARAWPSPDSTRVVLDFSSKPSYQISYLKKPDRLVLDLASTKNMINLKTIAHKGPLVKNIRESASNAKNDYRLVLDLTQASKAKVFTLPPAKPYGHRLVIDLPHQTPAAAKKATAAANVAQSSNTGRDVIIAIDAGHGGDDPGALGKFSYEKKITLQIAKRLKKRIDQQLGMRAFLIRNGDYYVNLNKRSELAVKGKADFLVSIHADGFTSSKPSGASVWILSPRRAESEMGRRMENHEVHSELLGGKGEASESAISVPYLNEVFFEMSKSNSMQVGADVANLVVKELKQITKLHKKAPVGASLAVLKSPYIPSILVEAGFITNHREERLLNQAEYQDKVANAVYKGIFKHFTESPPHDSLFAQKKRAIKHTVRSGESLSVLAERYSVSSSELKSYNRLKSSALRIGQVLNIPPNYELVVKVEPRAPVKATAQASAKTTPTEKAASAQVYRVKRGESLSVIASRYGFSTSELKRYNNLRSTTLAVGQKLNIPSKAPTLHSVKKGESLSVIAARYGNSSDELKNYNNLRSTTLAVGQKLKIPSKGGQVSAPSSNKVSKPVVHIVRSGESLSRIAERYASTTQALKSYNQLRSTTLAVGQKLKIPSKGEKVSAAPSSKVSKPVVHVVRSGESLSLIAKRYKKTTNELKNYNNLRSTVLAVGQKIKVPSAGVVVKAPTSSKASVHTVRSGESLSVIAARYGTSSSLLKHHNKLRSTTLTVGQKIKIPANANKLTTHKVRSGESLSVIAKRYGTSAEVIKSINKLRSSSLAIGQLLTVPTT